MFFDRLTERGLEVPMKFPLIPENPDPKKFNRLVYVDNLLPLESVAKAVGSLGGEPLHNCLDVAEIVETAKFEDEEYFIWMQDGGLYKGKYASSVTALFSSNERGAMLREGLFMLMFYPEIWEDHHLLLPGSWFGVPAFDLICAVGVNDNNEAIVSAINTGRTLSTYGCVSVARP
jgi:hypothetical protein